jgi:hypothetical protein
VVVGEWCSACCVTREFIGPGLRGYYFKAKNSFFLPHSFSGVWGLGFLGFIFRVLNPRERERKNSKKKREGKILLFFSLFGKPSPISHLEEEEEEEEEEDEPVLPKSEREAKALQGARNGQPTVDREMASDVSRSHRRPRGDAESNARDDCDGGDAEFVVEWPARVWKDDVRARFGANATWGSV